MSAVTSKSSSSKITEHLPTIEEPLVKQNRKKKKCSSVKTKIANINLPKLKSRASSAVRQTRFSSDKQEAHETALFNSLKCVENVQKLIEEKNFKSCSNAVGPTECQLLFKVPSSELNDAVEIEEERLEESNAIKRWEYWTKDKIRLQNYLSKCLGRSPCDLLIQKSDKIRQLVEDKSLLEYCQIPIADKWRGHPDRWKLPICLGNKRSLTCHPENCPKYCAVKLKEEKEISDMEFIGIPRTVQKEKGLICKPGKPAMNVGERMSYREERINYFMKQRKRLKPHEIQMDDLEVVGTNTFEKEEETAKTCARVELPVISIREDETKSKNSLDHRQSVFCLILDEKEIKYEIGTDDCQDPGKAFIWQINFGVLPIRTLNEKILRVENRGTIAVAYDWHSANVSKSEQKHSFDSLQPRQREPWFFFDKNSGFFLPGQIYDVKFYFYAKCSGLRKEVWSLRTKPPLSQKQEIGTIVLSAVATEELSNDKNDLEAYLRKRVGDSVVAFAIKILLYKVFDTSDGLRGIEYRSILYEKDLFEYHNSKYYYHSMSVKALKGLFDEISSKTQPVWDLSLDTLIKLIKTCNGREKNAFLHQISEIARKLLRPNYLSVRGVKKYKMTYEILCRMTNFMEEDYNYIRNLLSEKIDKSEEKTWSEEETGELGTSYSFKSEEMSGASEASEASGTVTLFEIKPRNFIFFQIMFYLKLYHRVCEAVEQIAGVLETRRLFQPHSQCCYKLEKPSRMDKDQN